MLKVLENTPDRLVIKLGVRPFHTTTATFDKTSRTAKFERTLFGWKRKTIEAPFDEIESIRVVQQSMPTGQGVETESNYPLVQLKSGRRFWLSDAGNQNASIEAAQQMREFLGQAQAEAGVPMPAADQPVVAPHPSRVYRWVAAGVSFAVAIAFLIAGAARISRIFTLPDCDDETTRTTLGEIFEGKKVKLNRLSDMKSTGSSKSERACTARADVPGGILNLTYRIDWDGWSTRVTIDRADAEAKIDSTQLADVKNAASDFLALAKDSPRTGRPPRQNEPTVRGLLDKVFDLSELEGATLSAADVGKANEWFTAGDRVGTIYILSGTGVTDIDRLPNDPSVQQRTHRNVAEFAPEFGRYLDFQVKLAGIMMDAEVDRRAKGGEPERPEVTREVAEVRSTLAESLTGALTTLAYDGLSDEWRRQRLAAIMQVAPKAATFLLPEQTRALREHALKVVTFVREPSVQDSIRSFADAVAR